jgi:hypothetical protein
MHEQVNSRHNFYRFHLALLKSLVTNAGLCEGIRATNQNQNANGQPCGAYLHVKNDSNVMAWQWRSDGSNRSVCSILYRRGQLNLYKSDVIK